VIDWGWLGDHLGAMLGRTVQHLELAAIGVGVGFAISFGLALFVISYRRTYPLISGISGILYSIPSLAVFAVLVSITGLSIYTAEIPLIMYTLVILVRNIAAGFDASPSDVLDAADGMGYGRGERFRRIVLPLSLPLLIAGLRLASVSTIGLVTITATLGSSFGGLGFFIFEGYNRTFPTEILAGAVPSILLAIAVDVVFVRIQRRLTPWAHAQAVRATPAERFASSASGAAR
jgi:osmoprotectant transport system permease protein